MIKDQIFISKQKEVSSAIDEIAHSITNPKFIIFMSSYIKFEEASILLHKKYPEANIIGMSGNVYEKVDMIEDSILVWGFNDGVESVCNVIKDLDKCPIKYIKQIQVDSEHIKAGKDNTICVSFATNHQERLSTTLNTVLARTNIELMGGTPLKDMSTPGDMVSLNGEVYKNACVYAFIKSVSGKVKIYKENIYKPTGHKMVVTKMDPTGRKILELNGRPALKEYYDCIDNATNGTRDNIILNSLCRLVGTEEYILATTLDKDGIIVYKEIDCNDILCAVELGDYKQIINRTVSTIKEDFRQISTIFTIDCLFRYFALKNVNYIQGYLNVIQSTAKQVGFLVAGEQYKTQYVNQTMVCAVFE